jgi:hypothetical protein
VLGEIEALGKEVGDVDVARRVKEDIYKKLFESGQLEIYFPLVREGRYKLTYSKKNPTNPRDAFIVEMYESETERDDAFERVKKDSEYEKAHVSDGDLTIADYQTAPPTSFVFQLVEKLSKLKDAKGNRVPPEAIQEVMRLFVNTLPETSFAKQLQPRQGTPGFIQDSMYALRTKGFDLAVQTQKLQAAADIRAVENKIFKLEIPNTINRKVFNNIRDELMSRGKFARQGAENKSVEDIGRRLNQLAFVYTIGFNASSAIVNLSQVPLFVMPYLGAKYGYSKTLKAVLSAGGLTLNAKNSLRDFYDIDQDGNIKVKDDKDMPNEMKKLFSGEKGVSIDMRQRLTDLMPLIKAGALRGQLVSQGYLAESVGLDEAKRAKTSRTLSGNIADKATGLAAIMFNHAEKFNRQNTMIASYELHLDRLRNDKKVTLSETEMQQEAVEAAIRMTQEANGGAYLETGPSLQRSGLGRVALMYKSYGLQMYASMIKQFNRAIRGATKEERKEARRILYGIHGTALLFAGIQGIPVYGMTKVLFEVLLPEALGGFGEDEIDFDTMVRTAVGEGWYKGGITAATGLDVASRTALTGLLFQQNKFNPDASFEEDLFFYFGGPAFSTITRLLRGGNDLVGGEIQRGIENIMPTAFSNISKGLFRYRQDGGVYSRRGDLIYDPSALERISISLGIQPLGLTQTRDQTQILKRIDKKVNETRNDLHRAYYIALRLNDLQESRRVFEKMMEFNKKHPDAAITPQTIERSLKKHTQTSGDMFKGVSLSPTYREPLLEIANSFTDLSK